ncbi:competence type IV pilus major pilin ComGC [Mitsuokella multacida]|uniref:competence type IV pilus major pilin ComGC n=1 Tax=Mitsuokella multacida TaxID=52226 RepID=UPI0026668DE2|nr:prepilin-type N-terminal cleavage/methylation domain-containing protein [Mitsuokella multacida]
MQTRQNEAGFTLIGMLIAVGIVAILAMIAVPKFTSAIASANTAKIQSDLSTLDTAVALYEIDNGATPSALADLKEYLQDADVKPPTGKCYLNGKEAPVPDKVYSIKDGRAYCGAGNTVGAFYKEKKTAAEPSDKPSAGTDG